MPTWLHWILAILLSYPIFLIIAVLVGCIVGAVVGIREMLLPMPFKIFIGTNKYLNSLQNKLVSILSVFTFLFGIYFLYNGIHIWASASLVVFAGLLRQIFSDEVLLRETKLVRWWIRFLRWIGTVTGLYFSYMLINIF